MKAVFAILLISLALLCLNSVTEVESRAGTYVDLYKILLVFTWQANLMDSNNVSVEIFAWSYFHGCFFFFSDYGSWKLPHSRIDVKITSEFSQIEKYQ